MFSHLSPITRCKVVDIHFETVEIHSRKTSWHWFHHLLVSHVKQQRANCWSYSGRQRGCHGGGWIQIQWWPCRTTLVAQPLFGQPLAMLKANTAEDHQCSWMLFWKKWQGQNFVDSAKFFRSEPSCPWKGRLFARLPLAVEDCDLLSRTRRGCRDVFYFKGDTEEDSFDILGFWWWLRHHHLRC